MSKEQRDGQVPQPTDPRDVPETPPDEPKPPPVQDPPPEPDPAPYVVKTATGADEHD